MTKSKKNETDIILERKPLMEGITEAKKQKELLTHKEVFSDHWEPVTNNAGKFSDDFMNERDQGEFQEREELVD